MDAALFGHIGGKNGLLGAELVALTPQEKPDIYIEPFGGSFGVGIRSDYSTGNVAMIHNELDSIIYSIFKAVTTKPGETLGAVYDLLEHYEYDQATVDYFRFVFDYLDWTGINTLESDIYLGAAGWILKNITYNSNCKELRKSRDNDPIFKVMENFQRREEAAYRIEGVDTFNMDALELLEVMKNTGHGHGKKIFIYVDAPYSHCGKRKTKKDLYRIDIDEDDRQIVKLADILEEINECTDCKIMVSEYDNPIYDKILTKERGWEKVKVCDTYKSMSVPDSHGCKPIETEYIWRNYIQ